MLLKHFTALIVRPNDWNDSKMRMLSVRAASKLLERIRMRARRRAREVSLVVVKLIPDSRPRNLQLSSLIAFRLICWAFFHDFVILWIDNTHEFGLDMRVAIQALIHLPTEKESCGAVWIIIQKICHQSDCCAPLWLKSFQRCDPENCVDTIRIQHFSSLQITLALFERMQITSQCVEAKS